MGGFARIVQDFMAAVSYDGSPEQVSGSVQLIPKVPYGTLWRVDSGEDIYTVPASQINCDIINGRLFRSGKQYVDIFAEDLGTIWTAIYTNVIVEGRPRHIHSVDFMVTPGEYTDLNRVGEVVPKPEPVWITLGTGFEARDQLRAALSDLGLDYATVKEIPFEIELVGPGSVEQLFQNYTALTYVPDMDTSKVTNMKDMFSQCRALTYVPDMDTSKVTNVSYMFSSCSSLTHGPALDTSQVVDSTYMYQNCTALTTVPDMDTSKVTNVSYMFSGCSSLTHGPALNTSQVVDSTYMYQNCTALTTVPDMDTSRVTNMNDMFSGCSSLTTVPDMDTSKVTGMRSMFSSCSSLTHGPALDTSQVVDSAYMYQNCTALIYVPDMDTSQNVDLYAMFRNCQLLTDGNVLLNVRNPNANTIAMIEGSGLTREPFYLPDNPPDNPPDTTPDDGTTVRITLDAWFEARGQLHQALIDRGLHYATVKEIPFKIELVGSGSVEQMFQNCEKLKTAPDMDTSRVTSMRYMFSGCSSLTHVPDMVVSQVTDVGYMFYRCAALTDGNVRLIDPMDLDYVKRFGMISMAGMSRWPFYDTSGNPI